MEFGAPRRREVSQNKEKYENIAVITVSPYKGKGTARMLTLNKKAIEGLELDFENDAQVSFSFDKMHNSVVVANTTGLKNVSEVRVAKTSKSLSDKKYFEAIKKNFEASAEDELELKLVYNDEDFNGFKTFKLERLLATDALEATVEDAIAETTVVEAEEVVAAPELDIEEIQENNLEVEAPLEYIQEQAAERDIFEQVAEATEAIDENPFANVLEENEEEDNNPFSGL